MSAENPFIINVLGPMEIRVGGQPIQRLRTRKGYWLLALLTLHHGRDVQREWLAGQLWPESWESQARSNLNLSLTDLRKALGSEAHRLQSVNTHTLRLDLTGAECDLLAFDTLAASEDRASRECAISLYRGALLEGCCDSWVLAEREQREQACLQLLIGLGEEAAVLADWRLASYTFRLVVSRDPYRDTARRQLMRALAESGDPNAALLVYQEFARFLRQNDLRAQPDTETRQLYEQIRSEARQSADTPLDERSSSAPPTLAGMTAGSSVPARISSLIGREQEILQVATALRGARLVTLTGTGGVGKTSLATVVAGAEAGAYPQGAAFVALDVLSDPEEIPGRILSVLGVAAFPQKVSADTLTEFLADKVLLLVLDNLEHLLSRGAAHVQEILRRCPGVTILVTSREPLGIPDEVIQRVSSLSVPDPRHLPSSETALLHVANRSDAVRLFMERATAKQADFQLSLRSCRPVIEICSRLDGIPFAIELAAARVVALPVSEIARRLHDCCRVLNGVNPSALPRQQTLTALMDWSYNLLHEAEQTLLLRLSVFVGGFTLEAAEAVFADPPLEEDQVLNLVASLVHKSLLVYQESEGTARYRMLETTRQYAAERLQRVGDSRLSNARHAAYFLAMAESQEEHLTSAQQVAALDLLDREYDNIQAALLWSSGSSDTLEIACRLAGSLPYFWTIRGHLLSGERWIDALVPRADGVPAWVRGKLLLGGAVLAHSHADSVKPVAYCEAALEIFRSLPDRLWTAKCLLAKSRNWSVGETEVLEALWESLEIFRSEGDTAGIATVLCNLGARTVGDADLAQRIVWLEEGIRLQRARGDYRNLAVSLGEMGYLLVQNGGDREKIRQCLEENLALSIQLKDRGSQPHALWLLGYAAATAGDYDTAKGYYVEGLALSRSVGGKNGLALLLLSLASVEWRLGEMQAARALAKESLTLYRDLNYTYAAEKALKLLDRIGAETDFI